jgi:hypothetical protein
MNTHDRLRRAYFIPMLSPSGLIETVPIIPGEVAVTLMTLPVTYP